MADLSLDSPSEADKEKDNANLRLLKQQIGQRKWVFWLGAGVSAALSFFFMCFAWHVIRLIQSGAGSDAAWPLVAISSITLISSVTIIVSLARFAYGTKDSKKDDENRSGIPQIELLQQLLETIKGFTKRD